MLSHSTDAPRFSVSSCSIWRRAMPSLPENTQRQPFAGHSFPIFEQKSWRLCVFDHTPYHCADESKTSIFQTWDLDLQQRQHFHLATEHIYVNAHIGKCAYMFAHQGAIKSENGSLISSPGCNIIVAWVETIWGQKWSKICKEDFIRTGNVVGRKKMRLVKICLQFWYRSSKLQVKHG